MTAAARDFWISGAGIGGGRGSRRLDEEGNNMHRLSPLLPADSLPDHKTMEAIMDRLRVHVTRKLAADRWMFEPTDYFEDLRLKHP